MNHLSQSVLGGWFATQVCAFPTAAKEFRLHDIILKAAGLPSDGVDFRDADEDKKKLGAASDMVFEHSGELPNTYQVSEALDVLSSGEFNIKSVSAFVLNILHGAMDELSSVVDTIGPNEQSILVDGLEVIGNHFKSSSKGTARLE